jgi:putative ABC transport system substrate-binding protein
VIRRREFITLLGGAAAAWPLPAWAQQPALPVIGTLYAASAAEWAYRLVEMRRGLGEMGFVEGSSVAIEYRWADNQIERLPALAADLIGRKVAVILAGGNIEGVRATAAAAAARSIPVVFTTASDPVAAGLVASLNRPGGNLTGVTNLAVDLVSKRLELLHEVVPATGKIALLVNQNNREVAEADTEGAQTAARRLGLELIVVSGGSESEIADAFATAAGQRVAALAVGSDGLFEGRGEQVAALALRYSLPTVTSGRRQVAAGQLISYGSETLNMYRLAGLYLGRILKGEKPADLPVILPTKFEMFINLKTAKAIGLTIPESFLLRADEVIE